MPTGSEARTQRLAAGQLTQVDVDRMKSNDNGEGSNRGTLTLCWAVSCYEADLAPKASTHIFLCFGPMPRLSATTTNGSYRRCSR